MTDDSKQGHGVEFEEIDRRQMLQRLTAVGGATSIGLFNTGSAAATPGNGHGSNQDNSNSDVLLGDFESGLDGWTTNGGNQLSRLSDSIGVANGESCLRVDINGDLYPEIENNNVRDADFLNNPHLQMYVVSIARNTNSDLKFKFRLHYTPSDQSNGNPSAGSGNQQGSSRGGASNGNGSGSQGNQSSDTGNPHVVESDLKTLPQITTTRIQWNMSEISDDILNSVRKLEITWYPEEYEPTGGAEGRNGESDYNGIVLFDDIRLSESQPISDSTRRSQKLRELNRNHGRLDRREIEEREEGFQRGSLVFADGASFPYTYEILSDKVEYTLDGEMFELEAL